MDQKCFSEIVVVGGGLAGISASSLLAKSGLNVVLVEAADYLGGRVKQLQGFEGWPPVDIGGEFIHGCKTITYHLAVENNWETEMVYDHDSDAGAEWIYLDGKLYPFGSSHPDIIAADTAYDDFIYNSNKQDKEDISAAEYFDRHPEFSSKSVRIFNTIFCQTEATNLDTYGSSEQEYFETLWPCGQGNYRMKNSQEQLIKYYLEQCKGVEKKLNWQAKEIHYTSSSAEPLTSEVTVTNQNGEILRCQAVIVCVPLTVLKDGDIHFKPELPEDKKTAIKRVQMHTGLKIICRFSQRFWPPKYSIVYNCTTDINQIWMYTNVNKKTGDQCHIVTGFQTADYAAQKVHLSPDEVKEIFINDLDQIFGHEETPTPASKYFIDFVYYHWSSNPFVRGAYSSPSVNARGSREILARTLENCVFFAGEATRSVGDSCTMSGAIESGIRAVEEVAKIFDNKRKL